MNIATAGKNHDDEAIVVHKLADKYRFKGSQDTTDKLMKEK